jgi:hypothetical protein
MDFDCSNCSSGGHGEKMGDEYGRSALRIKSDRSTAPNRVFAGVSIRLSRVLDLFVIILPCS